jgi:hypothetical protein
LHATIGREDPREPAIPSLKKKIIDQHIMTWLLSRSPEVVGEVGVVIISMILGYPTFVFCCCSSPRIEEECGTTTAKNLPTIAVNKCKLNTICDYFFRVHEKDAYCCLEASENFKSQVGKRNTFIVV